MTGVYAAVAVLCLLAFVALLFRVMWRVAEPNEALIVSGLRTHNEDDVEESLGFKIVTGKGTMVLPGVQRVRRLSLDLHETEMQIDCVTVQGIPLRVKGVAIFKVGDDFASIANSARRFLDQQDKMEAKVHNVFAGHLRSIVGSMKVEEMIRERERMTEETRRHSAPEMAKLGLIIDSLQIQEIEDPTGYIENLARPHAVAVARDARIAAAEAEREAVERQQGAMAQAAAPTREADIKKAGYAAEVAEAEAHSAQAGPLAAARAEQKVRGRVHARRRAARPADRAGAAGARPPARRRRGLPAGHARRGTAHGAYQGRRGRRARGRAARRRGLGADREGRHRRGVGQQGPRRGRGRGDPGPRPRGGRGDRQARRGARARV